jgi:prophage maintenance system killer protein
MALFLEYNGFLLNMENEALYDLGVNIASSKLIKIQIAKILKQHAKFVKK